MTDTRIKFEKKRSVFYLAVLLASFFCVYLSVCLMPSDPIDLSMTVNLPAPGQVKVFYSKLGIGNWSEENSSLSRKLPGGRDVVVKFKLPVRKLKMFRIDFEYTKPGACTISDLKLTGSGSLALSDFKLAKVFDISNPYLASGKLTLQLGETDPYVVLKSSRSLGAAGDHDYFLIGIVFALSLMFFGTIGKCVLKLLEEKKEWADLLLTTGFCLLICIPALRIDKSAVSLSENRALAPLPRIFTPEGRINTDFGQQFEKYFNDRFLGRGKLLKYYQKLKSSINGRGRRYAVSDAVVEGEDGWFFYRLENSLRNFQNLDVLTEKEMKRSLALLKRQQAWCREKNIKFYYFIAPDKNKVYGEKMGFVPRIFPDSRSRAARWVEYIRKNSDIKVIYPLEELKKQKHKGLLYYKNDTHWNWYGGYLGYIELMKEIKKDFPELRQFKAQKFTEEKGRMGDLYFLAPYMVKREKEAYKKPVIAPEFSMDVTQRRVYQHKNPYGKFNLCILRDSFCNSMLAYLFYSFAETTAFWTYSLTTQGLEYMIEVKTDVFILEHVERSLPAALKFMRKNSAFGVE